MTLPSHRTSRRRLRLFGILLALAALSVAGCAAPIVAMRVAGVSVGDRTDAGVTLIFSLEATNNASEEVQLREARYVLEVQGERVFEGVRSAEATLAARSAATINLPVATTWRALGVADDAALSRASLAHRFGARVQYVPPDILGRALFATGLRRPSARAADAGELVFAPQADEQDANP